MSRIVAFKADDEEEAEILAYMEMKHLKSFSDLARSALFAYMRQNRGGKHGTGNEASR